MGFFNESFCARVYCTRIGDSTISQGGVEFTLGESKQNNSSPAMFRINIRDMREDTLSVAKMQNANDFLRPAVNKAANVLIVGKPYTEMTVRLSDYTGFKSPGYLLSMFYVSAVHPVVKHLTEQLLLEESCVNVHGQPAFIYCIALTSNTHPLWWTINGRDFMLNSMFRALP